MKYLLAVFSLILTLSVAQNATAQLDKKEKKEWKQRIKSLSPEQYKALLDENKSLKSQMSTMKKEIASVDDRLKEKDDQIADYQDQVSSLRGDLSSAKQNVAPVEPETAGATPVEGVVFKVQIGAFKQKDISKFAENNPSFEVDNDSGTLQYTIGAFVDYWEADTFKKYLREMGVKDAWIVAYKDGERVPIKEVLEGVI